VASLASTVSVAAALRVADRVGAPAAVSAGAPPPGNPASPTASGGTTSTLDPKALRDGVWTGTAEYTRWGYIQVQATVKKGRLVDVTTIQTPTDRKSAGINAYAQPILEAEAVAQQGANLDAVSGATYTSRTYTASLQAALDQARPAATPSLRS
jgi:uncharacterized protein with FMN-binding domain